MADTLHGYAPKRGNARNYRSVSSLSGFEARFEENFGLEGMARKLRFIPAPHTLVSITGRTIQGRFLFKPGSAFNDRLLGILGRAQRRHNLTLISIALGSRAWWSASRPRPPSREASKARPFWEWRRYWRKTRNIVRPQSTARRRRSSMRPPRQPAKRSMTPTPGSWPPSGRRPKDCARATAPRPSPVAASRRPCRSWRDSPSHALFASRTARRRANFPSFELAWGEVCPERPVRPCKDVSEPLLVASERLRRANPER